MDLVKTYAELEQNDDLHLARLLILLDVFAGRNGTQSIEGLTKLAKLDFLLRYPAFLERALEAKSAVGDQANVQDFERRSIESRMVRFRYGPWDHRYRRLLNTLVGRNLASITMDGRTVKIGITAHGKSIAAELEAAMPFEATVKRARIIKSNFNMGGTNLMRFIYQTFPEITDMRFNEEI